MLHATTPLQIPQRSMAQSTDTCALPFISRPASVVQCDTLSTPGWGTSLGTVSFVTDRTWFAGAQVWSDAVVATSCNKVTFNGGSSSPFLSDCRSGPSTFLRGNMFSWCAVSRFHQHLCRAPWRVPTVQDFIDLDRALGGTGNNVPNNNALRLRYINDWGAIYGGYVDHTGRLLGEGAAYYWSQSVSAPPQQRPFHLFLQGNAVNPQATVSAAGHGLTLRCVRDCPVIPDTTLVNIGDQREPFCGSVTLFATGGANGVIYFQNTVSQGMDTTHRTNTFVVTQPGTYYFRARSAEGCWGPQGWFTIDRLHMRYPPRFTRHPDTRNQVSDESSATFPKLDVFATDGSAPPVRYQWYRTLVNRNPGTGGVRLLGAVRADYPPLRSEVGPFHYYAVATNSCGTDTSNVSGAHLVLLGGCTYPNSYPWGANLGTVSFASTNTWPVGSLIWSDVVQTDSCRNKTTFNGGSNQPFLSDCRSNPGYPGDLFSWCAAVKFRDTLCPAPWRLPTRQDFIDLDRALGGNGNNGQINSTLLGRYVSEWGATFGGYRSPTNQLINQGTRALYWARTEFNKTRGYYLMLSSDNDNRVSPQETIDKGFGLSVRCVRSVAAP
jgi:uncharacterized protein (TIGR02145 family)